MEYSEVRDCALGSCRHSVTGKINVVDILKTTTRTISVRGARIPEIVVKNNIF